MWKCILALGLALSLCSAPTSEARLLHGSYNPNTGSAFVQLSIGGGGLVSGTVISSDGKQFVRTDTATGFGRTSHSSKFVSVVTFASMPAGDIAQGNGAAGICAVAIAPGSTSTWYMYFAPAVLGDNTTSPPYVYVSTNNGATWVHTTNQPSAGTCNANNHSGSQPAVNNEYMDVSPGNENAVYLGTLAGGIFYTLNAGATAWSQISTGTIPSPTDGNGSLVKFDPSDATGNTVYISSSGNGLWKCTSALSTPSCAELNSTGMPTTFRNLYVDPLGTVWVTDDASGTGTGNVHRYLSGAWSTQLTGSDFTAVAVDPASTSYAVALLVNGSLEYSTNAQAGTPTWTLVQTVTAATSAGTSVLSTIIPWQQWVADAYLDANNMAFDPSQSHVLYMGNGDGLYKITPPTSGSANIQWNADETAGIENLDLTAGLALVGGGLGFSAQDRPLWFTTNQPSYPSQYYPNGNNGNTTKIRWGTSICGNATANTYIGLNNNDGLTYSTTGPTGTYSVSGQTGLPSGAVAGLCAVLTATNWIWMANTSAGPQPYFTNNSGSTWSPCTFGGGKTVAGGGWVGLAQDSTSPGTIIIMNSGAGSSNGAGAEGVWESSSTSACAFTQNSTTLPTGLLTTIWPVPGVACNFALTVPAFVGQAPNTSFQNTFLTTNCGASFSASPSNIFSSYAIGFGKANPAKDGYPAMYCQCFANDGSGLKFGIFQIDNVDTITSPIITNLDASQGGYPVGNLDILEFITGDLATYGTVYGGFSGSGGFRRTLNFLLKRDIDPASNDNDPMWLEKVA